MIEQTLRVLALLVAGMIGTLDRQLPPLRPIRLRRRRRRLPTSWWSPRRAVKRSSETRPRR